MRPGTSLSLSRHLCLVSPGRFSILESPNEKFAIRADEIRHWIERTYGVSYSLGGVYNLLARLRCSPKVPRGRDKADVTRPTRHHARDLWGLGHSFGQMDRGRGAARGAGMGWGAWLRPGPFHTSAEEKKDAVDSGAPDFCHRSLSSLAWALLRPNAGSGMLRTVGDTLNSPDSIYRTIICPASEHYPRYNNGSVVTLDDRSLLLVYQCWYTSGSGDASPSRVEGKLSSDGGRTWGTEFIIKESYEPELYSGGGRRIGSPSLLKLESGQMLLFHDVMNSERDHRNFLSRSSDDGLTWSQSVP